MFGKNKKKEEINQSITINQPEEVLPQEDKSIVENKEEVKPVEPVPEPEVVPEPKPQPKQIEKIPESSPEIELTEERAISIFQNHEDRLRNIESTLLRLRGAI